ncbi:MAG: lysophospholipid acyltransferase family protein [Chloroflexi bacterium]|jgi:lauroyl/myristoyl acyltransferase|nr:lysophospholipid acyltransferase family protein [Chloroflexota bacterium]
MRLNPMSIINSRLGMGVALGLGRSVPRRYGYKVAYWIADRISSQKNWPMVRAVRLNQWVVSGGTSEDLDKAVRAAFRHNAHCLYDLYRNLGSPERAGELIHFTPQTDRMIEQSIRRTQGQMIVGVHMSSFDMTMQNAACRGLQAQAITIANPTGGYVWQNHLRKRVGIDITPASKAAIRKAQERLLAGGTVMTGIDRPIADTRYRPRFFGRPASLPVVHVQLALKTNVPVYVVAAIMRPDHTYEIHTSEPIEMQRYKDRETELIENAETILKIAEDYIRMAPVQWSMFYPVWPEVENEVP